MIGSATSMIASKRRRLRHTMRERVATRSSRGGLKVTVS